MLLSDEEFTLETLDFTFYINSTPTFSICKQTNIQLYMYVEKE